MGCGKSSVAKRLARRLNREAVDLDEQIEESTGSKIAELFAARGEDAFRALETETLREALRGNGIIAAGGGIVTRAENRDALRAASRGGALVVYLRARPETLARRIRRQPGVRPLIDGGEVLDLERTRARVEELLAQRAPFYESCADVIIDTDGLTTAQVADAIGARLGM